MYTAFFGLNKKPFNMNPDPAFLFMTDQHREALAGLTYAILERKGFLAVSGLAGTGKTTLISWVLQKLPPGKVQSSVILNPTLTREEFLELAMLDFGIPDVPSSKAQRLWILQKSLLKAHREDRISVLIIDEAHKLSSEVLEEIRLLGNFDGAGEKLLQIVLVGQSEIDEVLDRPELWQFKQRIGVRLTLSPLSLAEICDYIEHRWQVAGAKHPAPFSDDAIQHIATWSKGIPRLINSICDNALVEAFADSARSVDAHHVEMAARDLLLIDKPMARLPVAVAPPPKPPEQPRVPRPMPTATMAVFDSYSQKPTKQSVLGRLTDRLKSG